MRRFGKIINLLKDPGRFFCVMFITACLTSLAGCAGAGRIHTESMGGGEIPGVFTLILYGGNYGDDLETAAFLDREGDAYSFDIFAPKFKYRTIRGLTFEEGQRKAEEFVSRNRSFHQIRLSSIVEEKAGIIGYEVRPLYLPYTYGTDDMLDIWYEGKGSKVVVTIKLKPSTENMIRDDFDSS